MAMPASINKTTEAITHKPSMTVNSQSWSIRDLASEFNITPRTLRFYEEKGMLNPSRDRHNRRYSSADRTRLRLILRGKRLGLTLEESNDIIAMYDPASGNQAQLQRLLDKIRDKRAQLEQQQRDLRALIKDLGAAEQRALDSLSNTNK